MHVYFLIIVFFILFFYLLFIPFLLYKVPTPPSNVTFPVIRSDRITVSWLRPSQGDSINYEIRYWRTGSGNSSSAEIVRVKDNQQTDLQTIEITNLEGNVSYSFQVWCQVNHRQCCIRERIQKNAPKRVFKLLWLINSQCHQQTDLQTREITNL